MRKAVAVLPEAQALIDDLQVHADPARAVHALRFFKTGPGEYGEGDRFLGVTMPQLRAALRAHRGMPLAALDELLASPWHEHRLAAVILMGQQYAKGSAEQRAALYAHYLARADRINNWDLVDASAEHVVGPHLDVVGTAILDELCGSELLWDRRIAMLATFHRIKRGESADALHVAQLLLGDREPLIHKAVGWMLREVGKRVSEAELTDFLDAHARGMPAVMLSYATERLTPDQRTHYRALRTS